MPNTTVLQQQHVLCCSNHVPHRCVQNPFSGRPGRKYLFSLASYLAVLPESIFGGRSVRKTRYQFLNPEIFWFRLAFNNCNEWFWSPCCSNISLRMIYSINSLMTPTASDVAPSHIAWR